MRIIKLSPKALSEAVVFLKKGGVVICPTDTVYGFLADASNKKAVEKIYKIKKRPKSKPLSLFVKDVTMAQKIALINEKQAKMLKKYWPGKYTFILARRFPEVGPRGTLRLYGLSKDTVGIRIPKHLFLQKLLKKVNRPLAQTSVNISTQEPLNKIGDIIKQFGKKDVLIIDGNDLKKAKPSKIIDLTKNKNNILRP